MLNPFWFPVQRKVSSPPHPMQQPAMHDNLRRSAASLMAVQRMETSLCVIHFVSICEQCMQMCSDRRLQDPGKHVHCNRRGSAGYRPFCKVASQRSTRHSVVRTFSSQKGCCPFCHCTDYLIISMCDCCRSCWSRGALRARIFKQQSNKHGLPIS